MSEGWSYYLVYQDQSFELEGGGEVTAGRSRTCEVSVNDPSVSRRHVMLKADSGRVLVKDLGSSNGTFVNGTRIQAGGELHDGDSLGMGDADLKVRIAGPSAFQTVRMEAHPLEQQHGDATLFLQQASANLAQEAMELEAAAEHGAEQPGHMAPAPPVPAPPVPSAQPAEAQQAAPQPAEPRPSSSTAVGQPPAVAPPPTPPRQTAEEPTVQQADLPAIDVPEPALPPIDLTETAERALPPIDVPEPTPPPMTAPPPTQPTTTPAATPPPTRPTPPPVATPPSVQPTPPPVTPPPAEPPQTDVRGDQATGDLLPSLDGFDVTMGPEMMAAIEPKAQDETPPAFNPYSAPTAQAQPAAGFGIRLLAVLVDELWMCGIWAALFFSGQDNLVASGAAGVIGWIVILFGWAIWGTTPGKRVFNLYVTAGDGAQAGIGFPRALARMAGYVASALPLCAGFLMIAFSKSKRGLHDVIAGTQVSRQA